MPLDCLAGRRYTIDFDALKGRSDAFRHVTEVVQIPEVYGGEIEVLSLQIRCADIANGVATFVALTAVTAILQPGRGRAAASDGESERPEADDDDRHGWDLDSDLESDAEREAKEHHEIQGR